MLWKKWKFRLSTMWFKSNKHIEFVIGSSNMLRIGVRTISIGKGDTRRPAHQLQSTIMIIGRTLEFQIEYVNYHAGRDKRC